MATATEQAQEHLAEKPEPLPNGSTNGNDKPQSPPDFGGRFDAPPASAADYRPPYKPAYGQQRFMSGQSLSQATGPTPTLNQLLQNNPPRPNSYDYPQRQPWPLGYPQGPYRPPHPQQQPPQRPYLAGPGAPQQGPQYPPYPQRYSTPPGPGRPQQPQQPYQPPPHQMQGAPYGPPMYGDNRAPSWGPQQAAPPQQQQQQPPPQQSPVPPQGPGTPTPPQQQQQQQQQYPSRPGQPATPNAHPPPDAGDQNSNDSSSGHGAAPGTPNSQQGLSSRPTPSPTGSTGSRSMSPAVQGQQQNIPIPPRPSSGQSEAPSARMSHSPIQAGYQSQYSKQPPYPNQYPQQPQQGPPPQQQQQPQYAARPYYPPGPGPQYRANHQQQPQQQPPPGQYYQGWKPGGQPQPPRPHTPPNYLKQHLQNKMAFGYGGMGPPPQQQSPQQQPPPPQQQQPMGPPPMVVSAPTVAPPADESNGATSVITTGPDGTPLDDASQQSTLSNASAASNEEPPGTPKRSKQEMVGPLPPPQQPPPQPPQFQSPGGPNSMHHDESYSEPPGGWPRTPASPVYNSHIPSQQPPPPPEPYRAKPTNNNNIPSGPGNSNEPPPDKRLSQRRRLQKPDSLSKLYEMDENPERRPWLDKLLQFMEERNTPINACPTISKNTLDLFRLYYMVKERNGFMEVTKAKTWKDIAILLNVGSSSSAAYTLRKHYTKHLLPFECHFDRGGIDPQPIISQVEASTKKKPKPSSVPSPGSSNSQDSFPPPGSGSASMDGYGGAYPAYPPPSSSSNPADFPPQQQQTARPSSTGDNVSASNPFDDPPPRHPHSSSSYGPPPPRGYQQQQQGPYYDQQPYPRPPDFNQPQFPGAQYQPRPMYPPYGEADRSGAAGGYQQDPYQRWPSPQGYPPRPYPASPQQQPPVPAPPTGQPVPTAGPPTTAPSGPPTAQPPQPQGYQQPEPFYRPDQYQQQFPPGSPGAPGAKAGAAMPPPQQPRRHPDFNKEQQPQQPFYGGPPRPFGAWSGNNNQFRPPATFSGPQPPPGAQWNQQPRGPQWDRYPPNAQGYQQPAQGQQWMPGSNMQMRPQRPYRPDQKPYPLSMGGKPMPPYPPHHKREHTFPPDSVEAALPVLYKRRRMGKADVAPVDAWRIMMSLRSGLLAESCWALDVLNVLLFDDQSVAYFGLAHLPGLLDLLLEHLRKSLADMFDESDDEASQNRKWYESVNREVKDVDLGCAPPINQADRVKVLSGCNDFSLVTRKGEKVSVIARETDPFVDDSRRTWDDEEAAEEALLRAPPGTGTVAGDGGDGMRYIVGCFRAEYGNVPFVRVMPGESKASQADDEQPKIEAPDVPEEDVQVKQEQVDESEQEEVAKETSDPAAEAAASEGEATPVSEEEARAAAAERLRLEIRDPAGTLKRKRMEDYEDEAYSRDEASLCVVSESQEGVARRCVCVLNVLRSLSFIPGNELELARSTAFLQLLGKLVALHHEHPSRPPRVRANYDRDDSDAESGADASCSSLAGDAEWWWEQLHVIRESVLVMLANIAGQLDLGQHAEDVSRPILDGLLHWAVCPAAYGQDAFPVSQLSPQRLALEALCKLCVTDSNVDLLLATPPLSRLERLCATLAKMLCRSEEQPLREFAVNLLHSLAAAASSAARIVATQAPTVSLLLGFIEQAEQAALTVANQHGIQALRDNPEAMGTSLDMLRRAAATLLHLSRHKANRPLFVQQEQRLLALVMSQILDQHVAAILARVLYQCSRPTECS